MPTDIRRMSTASTSSVASGKSRFSSLGSLAAGRKKPKTPTKRAVVLVDKLLTQTKDGAFYFVRVCGGAKGQRVVSDTSFQRQNLDTGMHASFNCIWREQIFVPVDKNLEIQVRKTGLSQSGKQLPSVLVGTVTPRESDGFATYPVLSQGALTPMTLSVSVPPMVEALDETATVQVDRLFGDNGEGEYILQAGLPGQETCTTPSASAEDDGLGATGATWHHVLTDVPQARDGISVVVFRKSESGVERIGRVMVPHTTSDFTKFALFDKDEQYTGREIRLNIPMPEPQIKQSRSWFRSLTSKTLKLQPKEAASLRKQMPTIEENKSTTSGASKRSRTPRRSTRHKIDEEEVPDWSDDEEDYKEDSGENEDEEWPAEPQDSWPEPEQWTPTVSVKDRIAGGNFKLSDSVVAAKERSGFSVPEKPVPQKKFGKDFSWPDRNA